LQIHQIARREAGVQAGDHVAAVRALEQGALGVVVGISELDPHQEPVELGFGQREGAHEVRRVLRRDDEEGLGEPARLAFGGDLMLLHRLEQRRLGSGRGAVHLVGEDELRENGNPRGT